MVWRLKRVLSSILLVFLMGGITGTSVYAWDDAKKNAALASEDYSDVASWCQGVVPKDGGRLLHGGTGSTVGDAACSYFATSYMLVKMGEMDPKSETPLSLIGKADAIQAWESSWGKFDFKKINSIYPKVELVDWKVDISGKTHEQQVAIIKGKMNEGLFVEVCTQGTLSDSGHYIFIDGFDSSGDMLIGDSGFIGTKWSDTYANSDTNMAHISTFKHSEKKANEQPSIYSGVLNSNGMSKEEGAEYNKIISEWDLTGMPSSFLIEDGQNIINPYVPLSQKEEKAVSEIKNNSKAESKSIIHIARVGVSFVGLLIIIYGIFLVMAYIFDTVNTFIEFSLLSLISFGRFKVVDKDEGIPTGHNKYRKTTYLTRTQIILHACLLTFVGLFLISGKVFDIIYDVYLLVGNL